MADITNTNNSVFCVHQPGSAASSVYVGTKSETSVLQGQLFNDVQILDHLKENIAILEKGPLVDEMFVAMRSAFKENDRNWIGQV